MTKGQYKYTNTYPHMTGDPTSLEALTALALNDEPERVLRDILSIRPFQMDTNRLGFDLV